MRTCSERCARHCPTSESAGCAHTKTGEYVDDSWITSKVKSEMIADDVRPTAYGQHHYGVVA
jgi:osmotically-inducible protein OsmY